MSRPLSANKYSGIKTKNDVLTGDMPPSDDKSIDDDWNQKANIYDMQTPARRTEEPNTEMTQLKGSTTKKLVRKEHVPSRLRDDDFDPAEHSFDEYEEEEVR